MDQYLRAFEGSNEALIELKQDGYKIALVTARGRESTFKCLEKAGIDARCFDVVIGREDTASHKPDPEPILLACRTLGIDPDEFLYIGDAPTDIEAALNAGAHAIFAAYGAEAPWDDKHHCKPCRSINALRELKDPSRG